MANVHLLENGPDRLRHPCNIRTNPKCLFIWILQEILSIPEASEERKTEEMESFVQDTKSTLTHVDSGVQVLKQEFQRELSRKYGVSALKYIQVESK